VKKRQMVLMFAACMLGGAIGGALLSPTSVSAAAKEIIELLDRTANIQQAQKDNTAAITTNFAVLKTLIEQQADANNKLGLALAGIQKSVQDMQANYGTQLDSTSSQVSGVRDNLGDMQQRLSKQSSQLADIQSAIQSLDSKVSTLAQPAPGTGPVTNPGPGSASGNAAGAPAGSAPSAAPTGAPTAAPPPSADTLYNSALHDIATNNYDLAKSEFGDYVKFFPKAEYASNAVFYLGQIAFVQKHYPEALDHFSDVIANFPSSFKLGEARYKRGLTYLAMGQKAEAITDLRSVTRLFPKTAEDQAARTKLKELGVSVAPAGR
jgi:tol-pal system protein YbgF